MDGRELEVQYECVLCKGNFCRYTVSGQGTQFPFLHLCVEHKFLGPFFHLQFLPTLFLGGEHNFLFARLQFLPTVDKFLRPISSVAVGLCVQHNMYHRISNILDPSHVSLSIIFLDLRFKNNWILRNKITVAMSKNSDVSTHYL